MSLDTRSVNESDIWSEFSLEFGWWAMTILVSFPLFVECVRVANGGGGILENETRVRQLEQT